MNAFSTTARDTAAALLGKPRARQTVHILTKRYGGALGPRYTVLVTGEYYDVGQRMLEALEQGATPANLELEPSDPEDAATEYPADDRACSAADRAYQIAQELS